MSETSYDVFLSHSSQDKVAVEAIARRLLAQGVRPFLDKWHLIPGRPWQEALEEALDKSTACAVFLGPSGVSPWQNEEMRTALQERARDRASGVIPVLLPGSVPQADEVPRFLRRFTWCDFRVGLEDVEPFQRLLAGIFGEAPGPLDQPPSDDKRAFPPVTRDGPSRQPKLVESGDRALFRLRAKRYAWKRRSVLDPVVQAIEEGDLPVILRGLRGIGKTTILAQAAVEVGSRVPHVLAIDLGGPAREEPEYVLEELNAFLTEVNRGFDLGKMRNRNQAAVFEALLERFIGLELLVLLDAVDLAPPEVQEWLIGGLTALPAVTTAATVQDRPLRGIEAKVITVPPLSAAEAVEFITELARLQDISVDASDLVRRLPQTLATHPQALATILAHLRDLPLELLSAEGMPDEARTPAAWVEQVLESMDSEDRQALALTGLFGGLNLPIALDVVNPPVPRGFQSSLHLLIERSLVTRSGAVLEVPLLVSEALLNVDPEVVANSAKDVTDAFVSTTRRPVSPAEDAASVAQIAAQIVVHLADAGQWSLILQIAGDDFLDLLNARGLWKEYALILRLSFRAAAMLGRQAARVDLGYRLARKLWQMGDQRGARETLDEIQQLIGPEGETLQHAELYSHRALVTWADDDELTLRYLERSRAIRRAHGDESGLLVVCKLIGNVHLGRSEYAQARAAYEEGLAIDPLEGEESDRLETETSLALCDLNEGEARLAADRLRAVIARMEDIGYVAGQPNALLGLALALDRLDRPEEALTTAREALGLASADPQVSRAVELLVWRLESGADLTRETGEPSE